MALDPLLYTLAHCRWQRLTIKYVIRHDHRQRIPPLHVSRFCHVSMLWRQGPHSCDCALLCWEPSRGRCAMCRRRRLRVEHAAAC